MKLLSLCPSELKVRSHIKLFRLPLKFDLQHKLHLRGPVRRVFYMLAAFVFIFVEDKILEICDVGLSP